MTGGILHACFPKLLKSTLCLFALLVLLWCVFVGNYQSWTKFTIISLELFHHSTTFSEVGWGRWSFAQIMGFSYHFSWSLYDLADHYIHSIYHIHMDVCTYTKVTSQRRKNVIYTAHTLLESNKPRLSSPAVNIAKMCWKKPGIFDHPNRSPSPNCNSLHNAPRQLLLQLYKNLHLDRV